MDFLTDLLLPGNTGIAATLVLYSFVIAAGIYIGKMKVAGVSLGVTFVLFVGILMGHLGYTVDGGTLGEIEFENFNAAMIPQVVSGYAGAFALIAAGFLLHLMPGRADRFAQRLVSHAPLVLQIVMAAAMIWCVMQVKSSDIQPFIYFQF